MSSAITIAGQTRINQLRGAEQPLIIDRMILALIPGLDPTQDVDRSQQMPDPAHIVHTHFIEDNHKGYVNPDQVVYSMILGSDEGNFSFNWIGTVEKSTNTIITVTSTPETPKRKTNLATNTTGNNITRNVMMAFQDAQNLTGVIVSAETWQFDFQAQIAGVISEHKERKLDPTDTDTVRNRHLSNAQGKSWEDHRNNGGIHASQAEKNAWNGHPSKNNNPHAVTKSQVGLGALPNAKSDSVALNNSNTLATAKAVKTAYDLANHKHYYSDGTVALKGTRTTTGTWTLTGLTINKPLFLIAGSKSVASYMVFKVSSGTVQNGGRSSQWWRFQSAATHLVATTPSCILIPSSTTVVISLTSTIQGAVAAFQ